MNILNYIATAALLGVCSLSLTQCKSNETGSGVKLYDLDSFIVRYNEQINLWVDKEISVAQKKGEKLEATLASLSADGKTLTDEQQKSLRKTQRTIAANQRDIEKFEFRKSLGGYFTFKKPEDVPTDLVWQTGMDQPEIGDSRAIKGGTFNFFINSSL